ncbi:uncharacterized protein N7487_011866 [Penicillium crustosum]|uniref:uncharacterized protein n=1 Tax=Penicillium crustosum TaxID=36656 RepID=UPI0023979D8B|nr:uncharacterized protein N7487_011866 [Penicillium crustosum]KAJ5394225.1 hypothetical protein N7487_011866 [Penicillium crustosum]
MSAQQQSLSQWVTQINDTLFIQSNDEIALRAVHDQVDPSLVVSHIARINHNVYNYDHFKAGLQYARSSSVSTQDEFSVILQWENPEKPDGVVAVLSKWTTKDKTTGKETKRTNIILWEVRWIGGKRKLTGQTEVESM